MHVSVNLQPLTSTQNHQ